MRFSKSMTASNDFSMVLEGHTHTYYAKQLAQNAVMEVVALPIRANEIKVS